MLRLVKVALVAVALISFSARADQPQISKSKTDGKKVAALKLGLSAPFGTDQAQKDGHALAGALTMALGHPVEFEVLPAADLGKALATGKIDIAWLTALEYIEAAKVSNGKLAPVAKTLRAGLPFYRSVLFTTKANKSLSTPADLKGKKLAFVADTSSAGYLLPHQVLLTAGLTEAEIKAHASFYGDHAAVCRAVLEGKADAGATISNDKAGAAIAGCVETLGDKAADLKVLSISDPIPNDVFALKPGASTEQFSLLRNALLDMDKTNAGKQILANDLHADGFAAADDGDFDPLRASIGGGPLPPR